MARQGGRPDSECRYIPAAADADVDDIMDAGRWMGKTAAQPDMDDQHCCTCIGFVTDDIR